MRSSLHHSIYTNSYLDRPILPSTRLDTASFTKYGLDPTSLIGNLGWLSLISNRSFSFFPEAVRQFYANLQLEGPIQNVCFSTFVEGHWIIVTPQLLQQVLGIPSGGLPVFNESDFSRVGFDPSVVLLRWADIPYHVRPLADVSVLPKYLQTDFSCLMFGAMVHYGDLRQPGQLPFGPAISFLLNDLGIPLGKKFSAESPLTVLRPSHALREVSFHLANSVTDSGGVPQSHVQEISLSDDEEDNNLAEELERTLQIEEALEAAALEADFPIVV
ncbi:hypothetical protein LINGRAPRIM_LOCUS320 [Linum grandiflorum]